GVWGYARAYRRGWSGAVVDLVRGSRPRISRGGGRGGGPRRQEGPVRLVRRDLQARGTPGHDHLVPAGHRVRDGHRAPRRRVRAALLQPGPGHGPRRGGTHDPYLARGTDHGERGARGWASTRWCAPTGPGSWSTRSCSRTSTTPSRCSKPATPAPTTSTTR